MRDFLVTLFRHPSVNGILMWGFWEGQHGLPDAALIRRAWPVPFEGFRLEQNTAASGPAWAAVSEAPAREAEARRVRVPLPGVGTRFYRLAR